MFIFIRKVNLKAPWCGAEYFHQDLVYWRDRGYPREDMLCNGFFRATYDENAPLNIFPKHISLDLSNINHL